ncbi:MAG: B12-binding domain-containing radical SAM protein [Planctomycetota bacterium]|nr:MAG: B12-binding domain-containing radical SAM protein [Planctomycetota bacterium]
MGRWKKSVFVYPYKKLSKLSYNDFFPPLGLEYIATAVKELVEEVTIIDMRYEKEPLRQFLGGVEVVGISINWPHQREIALGLIEQLDEGTTVIVGGIHATENVEEYLEASRRINIVVRGDGEETAQDIFSGKELSAIRGISYRRSGRIIHNETRVLGEVRDFYPDRSLRRYRYRHKTIFGLSFGIDAVMSSRGCPYKCEFCTHKLNPLGELRGWSARSAESVVEEIESIKAEVIIFSDDNFSVDPERVEKICDLLMAREIKKSLMVELRIEIARHPETLNKMWRAGFRFLAYGIESAQDKTLKRMGKGFTIEEVGEAFEVLRHFKMVHAGYFIVGYIGEDEKEMRQIAGFARGLGIDILIPSKLRAMRYSPLRKTVENTPDYHIDEKGKVFSDEYSIKQLRQIFKKVRRDFYQPGQLLKIGKKFCVSGIMTNPEFLRCFFITFVGVMEKVFKRRLLRLE